ncbi:MAG: hypothetical protein WC297_01310 [Candidatus Paceibacterota bacterium]|jgi:hypothetical protein
MPVNKSKSEIIFKAPDFEYQPKSAGWYWVTILIALGLIFLALWQNNFLFAVFVVIGELIIISWGSKKPSEWRVEMTEAEILLKKGQVEKKFNFSNDFVDFGIRDSSGNFKELVLKKKTALSPFLEVYFPKDKEEEIRKIVSRILPENQYPLGLMDSISRLLRF